jgi:hypothetical protein
MNDRDGSVTTVIVDATMNRFKYHNRDRRCLSFSSVPRPSDDEMDY